MKQVTAALALVLVTGAASYAQTLPQEPIVPSNFDVNDPVLMHSNSPASVYNPESWGDEGAFRSGCGSGHLNYDDPIVYPGNVGGSPHLHHYFGNLTANANSTYQSLRSAGDSTCDGGPINRTGYWYPAMINPAQNKVQLPDFVTLYYKVSRRDIVPYTAPGSGRSQQAAVQMPRGLKFIYGFNFATSESENNFSWVCEDGSGGGHATLAALAEATDCTTPITSGGRTYTPRVMVRTGAPNCWDGLSLDSDNHRRHMAYMTQDGWGHALCPPTHPYPVPQVSMIIWFAHNGRADFGQWHLSSDRMAGHHQYANGETFHSDWFGAWDTPIQGVWSFNCNGIGNTTVLSGVSSQICDGRALNAPIGARDYINAPRPETVRYAEIPPRKETPPPTAPGLTLNFSSPIDGTYIKGQGNVPVRVWASHKTDITIRDAATVLKQCPDADLCEYLWRGSTISSGQHTITSSGIDTMGKVVNNSITITKR